jgi:hypothetical protein
VCLLWWAEIGVVAAGSLVQPVTFGPGLPATPAGAMAPCDHTHEQADGVVLGARVLLFERESARARAARSIAMSYSTRLVH